MRFPRPEQSMFPKLMRKVASKLSPNRTRRKSTFPVREHRIYIVPTPSPKTVSPKTGSLQLLLESSASNDNSPTTNMADGEPDYSSLPLTERWVHKVRTTIAFLFPLGMLPCPGDICSSVLNDVGSTGLESPQGGIRRSGKTV